MRRSKLSKGEKVQSRKSEKKTEGKSPDRKSTRLPVVETPTKSSTRARSTKGKKSSRTNQDKDIGSDKQVSSANRKPANSKVIGSFNRDKPSTQDQKSNFILFLNQTFETGVQGLLNQYNTHLRGFVPANASHTAFDQNMDKNRYRDVYCGDNARVILNDGHSNGQYIHANYFHGEPLVNKFILTQGPMPNTTMDFWRMVLQERVENIFMLCETIEQNKPKCEQYWPREKDKTLEFGNISVQNLEVDTSDTTTIVCSLEIKTSTDKLLVKHHQWRTWPDKSVPQSVMAPFRLLKFSRWAHCSIIHCSAGIGRTGTVAILEFCLQTLLTCRPLSVVQAVQHMRTMRLGAVQTDLQLLYIHKCLIAYATAAGIVEGELKEKSIKFELDYNELMRKQVDGDLYTPIQPAQGFGGGPKPSPLFLT